MTCDSSQCQKESSSSSGCRNGSKKPDKYDDDDNDDDQKELKKKMTEGYFGFNFLSFFIVIFCFKITNYFYFICLLIDVTSDQIETFPIVYYNFNEEFISNTTA